MLAEICRSDQPLLFGGDGREIDRTLRRGLCVRPHARHLEQQRASRCVVDRAVVDRVAAIVRTSDAEVIVMRGVDDGLVSEFWIATGELRDDVPGLERTNLA